MLLIILTREPDPNFERADALVDILNYTTSINNRIKDLENEYLIASNLDMYVDKMNKLKERIKELEAPKSCDGCKYHNIYDINGTPAQCYSCARTFILSDNYESKDNQ